MGPCDQVECGGPQGLPCETGEFCEIPAGCQALAGGVCEEVAHGCPRIFDPVCGCDGVTYANDCERRAAGIPLDHRGECDEPPVPCGANDDCPADEYCEKPVGVCDDHRGVCSPRPQICPFFMNPVCGCDGETYDNECIAAGMSVSLDRPDACEDSVEICHIPPRHRRSRHTIYVGQSAVAAHLAHGDYLGDCYALGGD